MRMKTTRERLQERYDDIISRIDHIRTKGDYTCEERARWGRLIAERDRVMGQLNHIDNR